MSGSETVDSPQVKLVRTLTEGMRLRDVDLLAGPLHKDLRRVTYPKSLGRPEYNKEEWLQQAIGLFDLWTGSCEASRIRCRSQSFLKTLPSLPSIPS